MRTTQYTSKHGSELMQRKRSAPKDAATLRVRLKEQLLQEHEL